MTTEAMKSESATVLDFAGYQAKEGDAFDGLIKVLPARHAGTRGSMSDEVMAAALTEGHKLSRQEVRAASASACALLCYCAACRGTGP